MRRRNPTYKKVSQESKWEANGKTPKHIRQMDDRGKNKGGCTGAWQDSLQTLCRLTPREATYNCGGFSHLFLEGWAKINWMTVLWGRGALHWPGTATLLPGTGLTKQKLVILKASTAVHTTQRINDTETQISVGTAQGFSFCSASLRLLFVNWSWSFTVDLYFPFQYCLNIKELGSIPHQTLTDLPSMQNSGRSQRVSGCKDKQAEMWHSETGRKYSSPQIRGHYKESEQIASPDTDLLKKIRGKCLFRVIDVIQEDTLSRTKEKKISIERDCTGLKMIADWWEYSSDWMLQKVKL